MMNDVNLKVAAFNPSREGIRQLPQSGTNETPEEAPSSLNISTDEVALLKRDLDSSLGNLGFSLRDIRRAGAESSDASMAQKYDKMKALTAMFSSANTVPVKREIRKEWWDLQEMVRQIPLNEPFRGAVASALQSLTEVNNLTVNLTAEKEQRLSTLRRMRPIPSQTYVVKPPRKDIANFEYVGKNIFRGGQPSEAGYSWLSKTGKDVEIAFVDKDAAPPELPPRADIRRYVIRVQDLSVPTFEQVMQFFRILDGSRDRNVFVHCNAGIGRTGTFIACERIREGWSSEDAIAEADAFTFTGKLIDEQRKFIREFAKYNESTKQAAEVPPP